jgi:hypothetical protein
MMKRPLLIAIIATVIMGLYAPLIMGTVGPHPPEVPGMDTRLPDTRFTGYTTQDLQQYFTAIGPEQLGRYDRLNRIWDNLFPIVYGAMNMAWLLFLWKSLPIRDYRALAVILPLVGMGLDYAENLTIHSQLALFEQGRHMACVGLASAFTQLKWCFNIPLNTFLVAGLATVAICRLRGRKPSTTTPH